MTHDRHMVRHLSPALAEQAALERVLDELEIEAAPGTSLLVLTEDAGSATAQTFFADALATGPALASPAAFPWCLANAPCATIARRFGIVGPNVTWLVESLDTADAYAPVLSWLDGAAAPAIIAAMRFSRPSPRLALWHWAPADGPLSEQVLRADWCAAVSPSDLPSPEPAERRPNALSGR